MMTKLPNNFEIEKYGLHIRLVNSDDAAFILSLRTDQKLSRFINYTNRDVNDQIEWIRQYKEREKNGLDYYFIYFIDNNPIGVNRIYNIDWGKNEATGGSFVFMKGCPFEKPIVSILFLFDVAFNYMGLDKMLGDIRLGNKKVIKFHKILNVTFTGKDETNIYYVYKKDDFIKAKEKIEGMIL